MTEDQVKILERTAEKSKELSSELEAISNAFSALKLEGPAEKLWRLSIDAHDLGHSITQAVGKPRKREF